ncbi:MAG: HAD family hydrolase [Alphaproteobacteria bacterium]|nr:MAG: HAD family hydrolase [Alphaproteobacteria bacterium]
MNKKLVLFDYDGTIVDSAKMIVKGAIEAFRMCGLPDPDPNKVRENIGKPLAIALDAYAPKGYEVNPEMISNAYRKWYAEQGRLGLQDEPLYPGMVELIHDLKSNKEFNIGVATNKSRIALNNGLKKHNLKEVFDITLTMEEAKPKPDPDMAIQAMSKLNVEKKSTIIVGDTINDIGLGVNADINSIGVAWGYNSIEMLKNEGADFIVKDSKELFETIINL